MKQGKLCRFAAVDVEGRRIDAERHDADVRGMRQNAIKGWFVAAPGENPEWAGGCGGTGRNGRQDRAGRSELACIVGYFGRMASLVPPFSGYQRRAAAPPQGHQRSAPRCPTPVTYGTRHLPPTAREVPAPLYHRLRPTSRTRTNLYRAAVLTALHLLIRPCILLYSFTVIHLHGGEAV